MSTLTKTKRSTIYLEPNIHKALKLKSVETEHSISEIINEAIKMQLVEDEQDLQDFKKRKGEKNISFETFLLDLKKNGEI